jgi:phosphonate transport system substrate-binding protein
VSGAPGAFRGARAQATAGAPLTLGVLPNISARVLLTHYQPVREHLQPLLGRPVEVVTANDFRAFAQATREGNYDVIVTAPNLGRMAQTDSRWVPLASYEPGIPALLVGPVDKPEATVAQLRGKALALANPQSLVALVGLRWLAGQGLQTERDFQIARAPNDDSLGSLIRSGEAPFAIMSMGEFRAKPEALRQTLRIVTQIATVPGFLVMANPALAATERQKVAEAMWALPGTEAGKRFFALSGFSNIRRVDERELASLDVYTDVTRRSLFGEN